MSRSAGAIIYDFDGVIADSEALANLVLAELVTGLGCPTTLEQSLERYSGRRFVDAVALIEQHIGRSVPEDFGATLLATTIARFRIELREVAGATEFIQAFDHLPRCIASSSSAERLKASLEVLGLGEAFGDNVFSAEMVERGKPHPDLFLMAAAKLGVEPSACLVIEDSASGVAAARDAGMQTIGLCAASHLRSGHDLALRQAGATHCAGSWAEAQAIAMRFWGVEG